MIEIFQDDDLTAVTDLSLPKTAGGSSDVVELHVWNDKGNGAGQARSNILILDSTESPTAANTYLRSGLPPQDEHWGQVRVIGVNNTADPSWSVPNTDWIPLGAYCGLPIETIPPDCAVHLEYKEVLPSTSAAGSWKRALSVLYDSFSLAAPPSVPLTARGVSSGIGDRAHSGLVRGGAVTVSSPEDDEVHVAAAHWVWRGQARGAIKSDHTLNQNDGAAAALTAGQAYIAVLSLDETGVVVTKGTKGASPTRPATPAGNVFLQAVRVDYGAGGSVIEAANLEAETLYDRYFAEAVGLALVLHPGEAIGASSWRFSSTKQTVTLEASETNYVWQLASGLFDSTTTTTPPEDAAVLFYEADTDATDVTALRDRRTISQRTVVLTMKATTPGAPGDVYALGIEHEELHVDEVVFRCSDNGGGASGATVADWEIDGTSVYPGYATDDQRPTVAYNAGAAALVHRTGIAESLVLRKGNLVTAVIAALPVGGSPANIELQLVCRMP